MFRCYFFDLCCSWYHGSISRVDAENLLRVHREGSYLVRTSESNKLDYSLSVKYALVIHGDNIVISRNNRVYNILAASSLECDTFLQEISAELWGRRGKRRGK